MTQFTDTVFKSLRRHFVTLSCVVEEPNSGNEHPWVISGFLIEILNQWFDVTVGHVIRDLEALRDAGRKLHTWRLGEVTAEGRFENKAVPYDFEFDKWLVLHDADRGLDYATLYLESLYQMNLAAAGAEAIDREFWGDYVTEHDYWVVLGLPSETTQHSDGDGIAGRLVMVPIFSVDTPDMAGDEQQNKFYARLDDGSESVVQSMKGMSSSPIYSLKKIGDEWRYKVIGIQSGWYKSERILTVCPIASFAFEIERSVENAAREHEGASAS